MVTDSRKRKKRKDALSRGDDEPASVLLDRIRAEREAAAPKKGKLRRGRKAKSPRNMSKKNEQPSPSPPSQSPAKETPAAKRAATASTGTVRRRKARKAEPPSRVRRRVPIRYEDMPEVRLAMALNEIEREGMGWSEQRLTGPAFDESPAFDKVSLDEAARRVFEALFGQGTMEVDAAVRHAAGWLRERGGVDYERLRRDGALYGRIRSAIYRGIRLDWFDRPQRGYVRAIKASATGYGVGQWRLCLLASLAVEGAVGDDGVAREDALRGAIAWAVEHVGLSYKLDQDGLVMKRLRSAMNSAIRRGELARAGTGKVRLKEPKPP